MMGKTMWLGVVAIALAFVFGGFASADPIYLYVDAAPNVYGSPDYAPWWANASAQVVAGTFANMQNGINPANDGTTNFEIQDEVVYSFGDLGRRLTFIYYVPNTTIAQLQADNFQISLTDTWDGVFEDFYMSYYGSTWLTPTKWTEVTDATGATGVIGTAGMAWWGGYNTNTQAELDADIASWIQSSETWTFTAQRGSVSESITAYRTGQPVPEPASLALLGIGLSGLALGHFRKRA